MQEEPIVLVSSDEDDATIAAAVDGKDVRSSEASAVLCTTHDEKETSSSATEKKLSSEQLLLTPTQKEREREDKHSGASFMNGSLVRNPRKRVRSPSEASTRLSKRRRLDKAQSSARRVSVASSAPESVKSRSQRNGQDPPKTKKKATCFLASYDEETVIVNREPDEDYDMKHRINKGLEFEIRVRRKQPLRSALTSLSRSSRSSSPRKAKSMRASLGAPPASVGADNEEMARHKQASPSVAGAAAAADEEKTQDAEFVETDTAETRTAEVLANGEADKENHDSPGSQVSATKSQRRGKKKRSKMTKAERAKMYRERKKRKDQQQKGPKVRQENEEEEMECDDAPRDLSCYGVWASFEDLLRGFGYRKPGRPWREAHDQFLHDMNVYLTQNELETPREKFAILLDGQYWLSEEGFCVCMGILTTYDIGNHLLQHWKKHRFSYREHIFGSVFIEAPENGEPHENICYVCGLEDAVSNFATLCDCQLASHTNCPLDPGFVLPITPDECEAYFCKLCTSFISDRDVLLARRAASRNEEYEVERVVDHRPTSFEYRVHWKNYPGPASEWIDLEPSFLESVEMYWRLWCERTGKPIPKKARTAMRKCERDPDFKRKREDLIVDEEQLQLGTGGKKDKAKARTERRKRKSARRASGSGSGGEQSDADPRINLASQFQGFVPVKLHEIMQKEYITHVQLYTKKTRELKNDVEAKCRDKLARKVKAKRLRKAPRTLIENVDRLFDVDKEPNQRQVQAMLDRDWSRWHLDVAQDCYVIGEITDPSNPVLACKDHSIHSDASYGLFAIRHIPKYTVLFEYAGVINTAGAAEAPLKGLEHELDQSTLFTLVGHKHKDRDKNAFGPSPNDALVIDPHTYHNEGVYMNDYRENIWDDPDDEPTFTDEEGSSEPPTDSDDEDCEFSAKVTLTARKATAVEEADSDEKQTGGNGQDVEMVDQQTDETASVFTQDTDETTKRGGRPRRNGGRNKRPKGIYGVTTYAPEKAPKAKRGNAAGKRKSRKQRNKNKERPKERAIEIRDDSPDSVYGPDGERKQKRRPNVLMFEILVNAWPRVFAVAVRDIKAGDELLTDYGRDYWDNYRAMLGRRQDLDRIKARLVKEKDAQHAEELTMVKTAHKAALFEMIELVRQIDPDRVNDISPMTMQLAGYTTELNGLIPGQALPFPMPPPLPDGVVVPNLPFTQPQEPVMTGEEKEKDDQKEAEDEDAKAEGDAEMPDRIVVDLDP